MKRISILLLSVAFCAGLFAQTPEVFKYQAVVRDGSGNTLINKSVSFRISIVEGTATGTVVYSERHYTNTNEFGLVNLEIGRGTIDTGTMSGIHWAAGDHFLKIELDQSGGESYNLMGTSQLLSVPYALHAKTVETGDNWGGQSIMTNSTLSGNGTAFSPLKMAQQGALNGQVLKWNGSAWFPANDSSAAFRLPMADTLTSNAAGYKITNSGTGPAFSGVNQSTTGTGIYGLAGSGTGINAGVRGKTLSPSGYSGYFEGGGFFVSGNAGIGIEPVAGYGTLQVSGDTHTAVRAWNNGTDPAVRIDNEGAGPAIDMSAHNNLALHAHNLSPTAFAAMVENEGTGPGLMVYAGDDLSIHGINNSADKATMYLGNQGSGPAAEFANKIRIIDGTQSAGKVLTSDATGMASWQTPAYSQWLQNGTSISYSSGKVGIGTAYPEQILSLDGKSSPTLIHLINNATGTTANDGSLVGVDNPTTDLIIWNKENSGILFASNNQLRATISAEGNLALNQNLSMLSDKKISIGVANPQFSLDINGGVFTKTRLATSSSGTTATDGLVLGLSMNVASLMNYENSQLSFGTNGVTRMTIQTEGKVGIGTELPAGQLEIALNSNADLPQLLLKEEEIDFSRLKFTNVAFPLKDWTIKARTNSSDAESRLNLTFNNGTTGADVLTVTGTGEVHQKSTGEAHVLPVAYGCCDNTASILSGTGNFTCTWNSSLSRYEISITGENYSTTTYTTVVTLRGEDPKFATTGSVDGKLLIYIFNISGTKVTGDFQFATYRE